MSSQTPNFASFQLTIPPRCGHTGDTRCSTPSTTLRASRCQGGPLTTPPSSGVRLPILVTGVIQPLARLSPTSRLACIAFGMPDSSCGLQLANAFGPIHPTAQDAARQRQRGGGAVGHAPLVETRCDEDLVVAGQDGPDVGQLVGRACNPAPTSSASASHPG